MTTTNDVPSWFGLAFGEEDISNPEPVQVPPIEVEFYCLESLMTMTADQVRCRMFISGKAADIPYAHVMGIVMLSPTEWDDDFLAGVCNVGRR